MTNRKSDKKQNKSIRFVDLSFDLESKRPLSVSLDNLSTVSEGGYRRNVSNKGRGNLLSQFSFNKSAEDQQQMHYDIDQLIQQEYMELSAAPRWAVKVSRQTTHSGESPLFINKLLAPNKAEQGTNNFRYSNALLHPKSNTSSRGTYYRPNSTHQYLTNTELKDASSGEMDPKLGKPTRTTLLRARQRCNSAPINAYEKRRELRKRAEERKELFTNILNARGLGVLPVPEGETSHSFLIGARYNRAHYLDAKSVTEFGVYMPRGNPMGCFVIKSPPARSASADDKDNTPATPPESLESLSECESEDLPSEVMSNTRSPSPQITPASPPANSAPRPPSANSKPAWDDEACHTCKVCQDEQAKHDHVCHEREPQVIMQEVLSLDEGLNIKGVGVGGGGLSARTRPNSARPASARSATYDFKSQTSQRTGVLPQVHVQGMSTFNSPPTPKPKDTIDQLQMANQPSSSRSHVNTKDVSEKLQLENIYVRKLDVGKSPEPLKIEKPTEPIKMSGKPKVLKVDKAVNVPSLSGEPSNLNDFVLIGNKSQTVDSNSKQEESKTADTSANVQPPEEHVNPAVESSDVDNKNKKNRTVRFADEQEKQDGVPPKQTTDDPKFFLTEDNDEVTADQSYEEKKPSINEIATTSKDEGNVGMSDVVTETQENDTADAEMVLEGDIDKNSLSVNISDNATQEDGATSSRLSMTDQGTDAAVTGLDNDSVVTETPRDDQPIIAVDIATKVPDVNE